MRHGAFKAELFRYASYAEIVLILMRKVGLPMFFKYTSFEFKVFIRNRKQWILGLFLVLIFPVFFQYYLGTEPTTLESLKYDEKYKQSIVVNTLPHDLRDTEEGTNIFENHTTQLSSINMQIFYLIHQYGRKVSEYVEDGIHLNELRLEMHEKGNPYVDGSLIPPIEEIEKENEFLYYLRNHNLETEINPFVASQFLVAAVQTVSGLILYVIILLICSDMLVYENEHHSVLRGLPLVFFTKASSKVLLHYLFIIICLLFGALLGLLYSYSKEGLGNFSYPILVYTSNGFKAISIMKYLSYVGLGFLISVFMIVCVTLLLNIIFQHMYTAALSGIALFFLPDLFLLTGIKAKFLYPFKYLDITSVLSGVFAERFGASYVDYWHSITWMIVFTLLIIGLIIGQNWISFRRSQ